MGLQTLAPSKSSLHIQGPNVDIIFIHLKPEGLVVGARVQGPGCGSSAFKLAAREASYRRRHCVTAAPAVK